ncbi:hypothetical protein CC86DRAFT_177879 [Ophiobolus disseminans]|uniref:Uncharacterized protein n=1 Tax=Ophiobolus disseminans TaxID=1469910 RepID=A0A6A7AAP3_9PLEO|nr:hypothetical protein CC86DRAFT_177879 [Ophiobolus disseminans]
MPLPIIQISLPHTYTHPANMPFDIAQFGNRLGHSSQPARDRRDEIRQHRRAMREWLEGDTKKPTEQEPHIARQRPAQLIASTGRIRKPADKVKTSDMTVTQAADNKISSDAAKTTSSYQSSAHLRAPSSPVSEEKLRRANATGGELSLPKGAVERLRRVFESGDMAAGQV